MGYSAIMRCVEYCAIGPAAEWPYAQGARNCVASV